MCVGANVCYPVMAYAWVHTHVLRSDSMYTWACTCLLHKNGSWRRATTCVYIVVAYAWVHTYVSHSDTWAWVHMCVLCNGNMCKVHTCVTQWCHVPRSTYIYVIWWWHELGYIHMLHGNVMGLGAHMCVTWWWCVHQSHLVLLEVGRGSSDLNKRENHTII